MTGMDDWHGWLAELFLHIVYRLTDWRTDRLTMVLVKSLSRLKMVFYDLWLVALDSIEMAWVMSNWVISIGQWSHETGFQKSESLSRIIQDLRIIQELCKFYYLFGVLSDICLNTVWCTDWLGRLHKMMGRNHRCRAAAYWWTHIVGLLQCCIVGLLHVAW